MKMEPAVARDVRGLPSFTAVDMGDTGDVSAVTLETAEAAEAAAAAAAAAPEIRSHSGER